MYLIATKMGIARIDFRLIKGELDLVALLMGRSILARSRTSGTPEGTNRNDRLLGDAGPNAISGLGGNDTINGGNGNDTLNGNSGQDRLFGNNGGDRLVGGIGNDTINGGNGSDQLIGGSGRDLMVGGQGRDRLTGNSGADEFRWGALTQSKLGSIDRITDLNIGTDILNGPRAIRSQNIDQLGSVSALSGQGIQQVLTDTVFEANTAATFRRGSSTYLAINDSRGGFQGISDAIVDITGFSGQLSQLSIV